MTAILFNAEKFYLAMNFDKNDPQDGLADNAALLGFYGTQQGLWEGLVIQIKMKLETQEAITEIEIRGKSEKKTATAIASEVAVDSEVQVLKKRLCVAKEQDTLYSNACKALHDRGNNIRSTGTWLRSERSFTNGSFSDEEKQYVNDLVKS